MQTQNSEEKVRILRFNGELQNKSEFLLQFWIVFSQNSEI